MSFCPFSLAEHTTGIVLIDLQLYDLIEHARFQRSILGRDTIYELLTSDAASSAPGTTATIHVEEHLLKGSAAARHHHQRRRRTRMAWPHRR